MSLEQRDNDDYAEFDNDDSDAIKKLLQERLNERKLLLQELIELRNIEEQKRETTKEKTVQIDLGQFPDLEKLKQEFKDQNQESYDDTDFDDYFEEEGGKNNRKLQISINVNNEDEEDLSESQNLDALEKNLEGHRDLEERLTDFEDMEKEKEPMNKSKIHEDLEYNKPLNEIYKNIMNSYDDKSLFDDLDNNDRRYGKIKQLILELEELFLELEYKTDYTETEKVVQKKTDELQLLYGNLKKHPGLKKRLEVFEEKEDEHAEMHELTKKEKISNIRTKRKEIEDDAKNLKAKGENLSDEEISSLSKKTKELSALVRNLKNHPKLKKRLIDLEKEIKLEEKAKLAEEKEKDLVKQTENEKIKKTKKSQKTKQPKEVEEKIDSEEDHKVEKELIIETKLENEKEKPKRTEHFYENPFLKVGSKPLEDTLNDDEFLTLSEEEKENTDEFDNETTEETMIDKLNPVNAFRKAEHKIDEVINHKIEEKIIEKREEEVTVQTIQNDFFNVSEDLKYGLLHLTFSNDEYEKLLIKFPFLKAYTIERKMDGKVKFIFTKAEKKFLR